MRVAIHTLGCKVNQYESQAMEEILTARGHTLVPFEDPADVYIVNSCTVTATSDKKSRQAVRQARKRAPEALVALCGCYPQVSPEDARKIDADLIGGSGDRLGFLDLLELCRERWKWGQRLGRAARRAQKSSVTVRGSREPRRTRISGTAWHTASIRLARSGRPGRSRP